MILTPKILSWCGQETCQTTRCFPTIHRVPKLPTCRATSGLRMEGKNTWIMTPKNTDPSSSCTPTSKSISGNSTSITNLATYSASSGSRHGLNNASNFSLNLTPEATLVLQKRSGEKQLRVVRGTVMALHQKDPLLAKSGSRSNIPLVKISLLNERHRYDDVEYEEDEEQSVDQSVLLKCSEWLRGVENATGAAVLGRVDKISQKSIE
uniref:Si:dkeyp-57d7.4 n=1 Tax=Sinocyclocheilus rhinocerous TaxID=307959 RepID=A0A673KMP8_9TELE